MPTVTLNKKQFLKIIGKSFNDNVLKEKIPMLGTGLEGITKDEINIEIFPNRPDMLSEQGLARAFSSFMNIKTGLRNVNVKKSNEKVIIEDSVKDIRPFTACCIVKNLKFSDENIKSIIQIQEKLHVTYGRNRKKCAIGIYPCEKISMPIYYKALEPSKIKFKPLEARRDMDGNEVLSAYKDYAHLLEGYKKYPVFVDSTGKILSMPPIINSEETGRVTAKTKDVFIECSGFSYDVVAKCLNIIVYAIADMGGRVYSMELVYGKKKITSPDLKASEMKLDLNYVNKRLGISLGEKEAVKLLAKMGYGYKNKKVLVPAYRADILHEIDLVEDIAIAYGYENFAEEIPNVATIGAEAKIEIFKNKLTDILVGYGLIEVNTFNLTSRMNQIDRMNVDISVIELANALNEDYDVLRAWLIPSFLEILKNNKHNEYPQEFFGFGDVFKKDDNSETGVGENVRLCCMLCSKEAYFTRIMQILRGLFSAIDARYEIRNVEHPSFISGRVGRVSVNGKDIAYIGEIHPAVLGNFELELPVACFELNISELFEAIK